LNAIGEERANTSSARKHFRRLDAGTQAQTERPETERRFSGWLQQWAVRNGAQRARVPLDSKERSIRLSRVDAELPQDYLEITEQTEGLEFKDCAVFGLSDVREFAGDDGNYYLLAELNGRGVLGVRAGSQDRRVFYLGYDHDQDEYLSFREAMGYYFENVTGKATGRQSQAPNA